MKTRTLVVACVAAIVALAATLTAAFLLQPRTDSFNLPPPSPYRGSIPPPSIRAPDFTLRDYRGRRVSMSALRGSVVLLSFVDSKCKESCPIVAAVMARAMQQLPRRDRHRVLPLLMSVNPTLDTPTSIHRFLARRRALALSYLVGTVRHMRPIWKAYGVVPAIDTGDADVHSSDVRVFDRNGIWVSTQHAGVDLTASNLIHDTLLALTRGPTP